MSYIIHEDGGGGTRTPKGFRPPHFECGALPIRLRLRTNRVYRLRGAATFFNRSSIGAPGFEPGTSATRTQRSTGLSHAPKAGGRPCDGREVTLAASRGREAPARLNPGFEGRPVRGRAPPANGRGGIRTHVGVSPHDFQSCALSHSATRPKSMRILRQPKGVKWDSQPRPGASRARRRAEDAKHRRLNPGFESQLPSGAGSARQRRGWDSNPRDPHGSTP